MIKVFMMYEVNPTTWFYLSSLMIVGIFFKFRRVWSVRNLDLVGLLFLFPGVLMVANEAQLVPYGYFCILFVSFFLLVRMLCDPMMARRPLLDVNLSTGGLLFCCIALLVFQVAGVALTQWRLPGAVQTATLEQLMTMHLNERLLADEADEEDSAQKRPRLTHGPGLPFFTQFSDAPRAYLLDRMRQMKQASAQGEENAAEEEHASIGIRPRTWARAAADNDANFPYGQFWLTFLAAVAGQIAIAVGLMLTGWRHFENFATGVAAATLYLLIPYAAQMPSRLDHIIPGALLVWAVFCWHRPALAGILLGTAAALAYYPVFLIPLWCSFYLSKGLYRFAIPALSVMVALFCLAIPLAGGWENFFEQSGDIFGFVGLFIRSADGIWESEPHSVFYRAPVLVTYMILVCLLAFWPAQKNLGTLLSSSAALMVGAQFCQPFQGGMYMAWFLPFMILVIFRPNLENRTAKRVIDGKKRRTATHLAEQ
ncbi:MAG: hypothetical protein Q4D38_02330 [Planctomycetia bacterium]|nr:hypothetical protein [Planctomycetia bacterium]